MNKKNIKDYYKHPSLLQKSTQRQTPQNDQINPFSQKPTSENPFSNKTTQNQEEEKPQIQTTSYADKNIKKFPRALIKQERSSKVFVHSSTENFEEPPLIYEDFIVKEDGNATMRHALSSVYLVPDNSSNLGKSQIKFSVVFSPLAETREEDTQIPYSDKRIQQILRCERCGTFVNPFFTYDNNFTKYTCNICDFSSNTPNNFLQDSQQNQEFPEAKHAVYDFIVPDSYKLNDFNSNNILLCFDMSHESIQNGSLMHELNSLKNLVDYLDEDTHLGFVMYDSQVSFLRMDDEEKEISILRGCDTEAPVCPLAFKELFFNVKSQKEHILAFLNYFENMAMHNYEQNVQQLQNSPHDLQTLSLTLESVFQKKGGRVIIFTSIHKKYVNEIVKYESKDKILGLKPKVKTFYEIGEKLCEQAVTVDLFITSKHDMELQTISYLSLNTSGNVYYYPEFEIQNYSDKLYYDLYRSLIVQRGFDVACRLRTSGGLQTLYYLTPRGKIHTLDFRLPSLSADQHIVAQLGLGENLKGKKKVYLQFVTLFTNSYDTRLMRIINLSLNVTNDMQIFYKNMDQHGFTYSFIQKYLYELVKQEPKEVNKQISDECVKLFRYYRNEVGGRYDSREFALADKLRFFPIYLFSALSNECFNFKIIRQPDIIFNSFLRLKQLPLQHLFFYLYPKIFDINLMFNDWKIYQENYQPGYEIEGKVILPDSSPCNSLIIDKDSIFLVDNGIYIYLFISGCSDPEILGHLLGQNDFSLIESNSQLPEVESDFNTRIHSIIERLKEIKTSSNQTFKLVLEGQDHFDFFRCFVESNQNVNNSDYWDYLTQMHENVKDD